MQLQDEHWLPGEAIAKELGTNRTAILEQMLMWWLRIPGAQLPERPPPEVIADAYAAWRAETDGGAGTEEPTPEDGEPDDEHTT